MPLTLDQQTALKQIQKQVDTFEVGKTRVRAPDMTPVYFAEGKLETLARRLGDLFWLPTERANRIFLYAYSALFGIPTFTAEALARMPDRFSEKRLPLTIRSTSSFILDGFGFDRRVERTRDLVYWPGHSERTRRNPAGQTPDLQPGHGLLWLPPDPGGRKRHTRVHRCGPRATL